MRSESVRIVLLFPLSLELRAVRRVAVGGVPDGLAFDASGRFLLASDLSGGVVSVIDVADARVSARFDTGESAGALLILAH